MSDLQRICLFQFHKEWDVCGNRLEILRALNPDLPVYGLFGGAVPPPAAVLSSHSNLVDVFHLRGRSGRWLWQNTDLTVREWFRARGQSIAFDVAHVVQWDLLLLGPLPTLYHDVPRHSVGLTGLTALDAIAARWHWTLDPIQADELLHLRRWVKSHHREPLRWHACLGPGYVLPRSFLEAYARVDVPELTHDEIRLPLFAEILGFDVADTGFYRQWFDAAEESLFNANGVEIDESRILMELRRPEGRRTFHPYRRIWPTSRGAT